MFFGLHSASMYNWKYVKKYADICKRNRHGCIYAYIVLEMGRRSICWTCSSAIQNKEELHTSARGTEALFRRRSSDRCDWLVLFRVSNELPLSCSTWSDAVINFTSDGKNDIFLQSLRNPCWTNVRIVAHPQLEHVVYYENLPVASYIR